MKVKMGIEAELEKAKRDVRVERMKLEK